MQFDHANQKVPTKDIFRNLIARGFAETVKAVNHPGQLTCEFIVFGTKPSQRRYIEFCCHDKNLPKDHREYGNDPAGYWPGLSLRTDQSLEVFYERLKEDLKDFKPTFSHKNYDWARDNISRLP